MLQITEVCRFCQKKKITKQVTEKEMQSGKLKTYMKRIESGSL